MQTRKHNFARDARNSRELFLTVLTEILSEIKFLDNLEAEALSAAERFGPIRGRILRRQRIWSQALDQIEASRQDSLSVWRAA